MGRDLRVPSVPARDRGAVLHPSSVLPTTPTCDFTGLALRPNILPRKRKGPKGEDPSTWGAQQARLGPPGSPALGKRAPHLPASRAPASRSRAAGVLLELSSSEPPSSRLCSAAPPPTQPGSRVHGRHEDGRQWSCTVPCLSSIQGGDLGLPLQWGDTRLPHPPPLPALSTPHGLLEQVES